MSTYIIFFGKSQDFNFVGYDEHERIDNFNKIISDFDLLESVYFSIDDINNKDTLSRYNFARAGKQYCLVKLYSFAQAIHGNRIEGSSMGVGILSDHFIDFSEYNLSILRAAKDKFSELSLSGLKFNKPTFSADTDKIWKGLVNSSNGNLISKIDTTGQAKSFENSNQPYGFYLKSLFIDAHKLDSRISKYDTVYLSEDLEHFERAQSQWGVDKFPIYHEKGDHFIEYKKPSNTPTIKEELKIQKSNSPSFRSITPVPSTFSSDNITPDIEYKQIQLEQDIERLQLQYKKSKRLNYILLFLLFISILVSLFSNNSESPNSNATNKTQTNSN
jgi:hypothetical protein